MKQIFNVRPIFWLEVKPGARRRPHHLSLVAGLVAVVVLSSSLIAVRGALMAHPQDNPAKTSHAMHQAKASQSQHSPEHCQLCFTHLVEASGIEDTLVKRVHMQFAQHLWLGQAQAKDQFLKAIAARGPPTYVFHSPST